MSSVNVVFLSWFLAEMHAAYVYASERRRGCDLKERLSNRYDDSQIKHFNGQFFAGSDGLLSS